VSIAGEAGEGGDDTAITIWVHFGRKYSINYENSDKTVSACFYGAVEIL
jgi:hypothetical protein